MLLTVITVCKDAEKVIHDTIVSVLDQEFSEYEYLIWDGASSDDTLGIIDRTVRKYMDKKESLKEIQVISEADSGIYDAMNKAVKISRGQWILFLNAGDRLLNGTVLKRVFSQIKDKNADIIYGDRIVVYDSGLYYFQRADSLEMIKYQMPFCHQSTICRREILEKYPFNEKEKIFADYEFFIDCCQHDYVFLYCPDLVCLFADGGVGTRIRWDKISLCFINISYRKGLVTQKEYEKKVREIGLLRIKMGFYSFFKKILPDYLVQHIIYKARLKRGMKESLEEVLLQCGVRNE